MRHELTGWLLSIYADEIDGAVIWLLGEDGKRYRLTQPFATIFYVSGDEERLENIRDDLQGRDSPPRIIFLTRQDLYKGMLPVLRIQVDNPIAQQKLFQHMRKSFKWVHYFDAEIPSDTAIVVAYLL